MPLPWFCPRRGSSKQTSRTAARDAEVSQQQRLPGILSQELVALHGAYAPLPCHTGSRKENLQAGPGVPGLRVALVLPPHFRRLILTICAAKCGERPVAGP